MADPAAREGFTRPGVGGRGVDRGRTWQRPRRMDGGAVRGTYWAGVSAFGRRRARIWIATRHAMTGGKLR